MPTNNAPPQRTDEHRNTVVGEKIPHHWAKAESCVNKSSTRVESSTRRLNIIINKNKKPQQKWNFTKSFTVI